MLPEHKYLENGIDDHVPNIQKGACDVEGCKESTQAASLNRHFTYFKCLATRRDVARMALATLKGRSGGRGPIAQLTEKKDDEHREDRS